MERLTLLAGAGTETVEFTTADYGGVRTEEDTAKILRYREAEYALYLKRCAAKEPAEIPKPINEWRKIAPFGKSHHNWGCARDNRPLKYRGQWVVDPNDYSKITDPKGFQAAHDRLDTICESDPELKRVLKIGDYFNDEPHVELRISLDDARHRYIARLNPPAPAAAGHSKPGENQV